MGLSGVKFVMWEIGITMKDDRKVIDGVEFF